jgi:hypothetical protein
MGRQTSVALSEDDEREFLAFLRDGVDVKVLSWAARTPDQIFIPEFPRRGPNQHHFRLWNTAFPWNPEFAQWEADVADRELASQYYLKNTAGAPLIEYVREPFENPKPIMHGRIYWNTDFAIYRGLTYDIAAFNLWFNRVVRWLRKNSTRVQVSKGWYQYWLPGAWEMSTALATQKPSSPEALRAKPEVIQPDQNE